MNIRYKCDDNRSIEFDLVLDDTSECKDFVDACVVAEVGRRVGVRGRKDGTVHMSGEVMWKEFGVRRIAGAASISRQAKINAYLDGVKALMRAPQFAELDVAIIMTMLQVPADMQQTITLCISGE